MITNAGIVFACGKSAHTASGSGAWGSHNENQNRSSLKARTRFTMWPIKTPPGPIPSNSTYHYSDTWSVVFIAALFLIVMECQQPTYLLFITSNENVLHHTMEYYSALKKK